VPAMIMRQPYICKLLGVPFVLTRNFRIDVVGRKGACTTRPPNPSDVRASFHLGPWCTFTT
jgi:hypothetical protein